MTVRFLYLSTSLYKHTSKELMEVITIVLKPNTGPVEWVSVSVGRALVNLLGSADNLPLVLVPIDQHLPPVNHPVSFYQCSVHTVN